MFNPLVSILMPVRQWSPFIEAAVESVITQSHTNLELLLIGKNDIHELVQRLPSDSRLRGIAREQPGIIGALNTGLKSCHGDYIARMDDDDLCTPNRIEHQLAMAATMENNALIGARVDIFSNDATIGRGNAIYQQWLNAVCTNEQIRRASFIESPLPHPTFFAHKSFWTTMGGYHDQGWPEDYDLILRAWLAGMPMSKPEPILLRWREHANRLTRTDSRYSREAFTKAKAWALSQSAAGFNLHAGRAVWVCGTGRNARYWHDALIDQGVTVRGFVELDTAKTKHQKRHLPVITYQVLEQNLGDALCISAISNHHARKALQQWFVDKGLTEGKHFLLGG